MAEIRQGQEHWYWSSRVSSWPWKSRASSRKWAQGYLFLQDLEASTRPIFPHSFLNRLAKNWNWIWDCLNANSLVCSSTWVIDCLLLKLIVSEYRIESANGISVMCELLKSSYLKWRKKLQPFYCFDDWKCLLLNDALMFWNLLQVPLRKARGTCLWTKIFKTSRVGPFGQQWLPSSASTKTCFNLRKHWKDSSFSSETIFNFKLFAYRAAFITFPMWKSNKATFLNS